MSDLTDPRKPTSADRVSDRINEACERIAALELALLDALAENDTLADAALNAQRAHAAAARANDKLLERLSHALRCIESIGRTTDLALKSDVRLYEGIPLND